jgi:hypothetical protein
MTIKGISTRNERTNSNCGLNGIVASLKDDHVAVMNGFALT